MSEAKPPPGRLERAEAFLVGLAKVIAGVGLVLGAIYGVITALQPLIPTTRPSPAISAPAAPTPSPSSIPNGIAVRDVYNVIATRGLEIVEGQGFTDVRVENVCSDSVAAGRIRQVLLTDGTELVGQGGPTGVVVSLSERVRVKVSNGKKCPG